MSIQNLQSLIQAKERQTGVKIIERDGEKQEENSETGQDNKEVLEILKLVFEYLRESIGQINQEITIIKQQQQKILEKLENNVKSDHGSE